MFQHGLNLFTWDHGRDARFALRPDHSIGYVTIQPCEREISGTAPRGPGDGVGPRLPYAPENARCHMNKELLEQINKLSVKWKLTRRSLFTVHAPVKMLFRDQTGSPLS